MTGVAASRPSQPSRRSPLRRTGGPLNHAVYDLLKERLLEGHYPAGTRLPTDDLRLELGVSKQPVMEALRRLSADGMIEIVPQVGCSGDRLRPRTRSRTSTSGSAASRAASPASPHCAAPTNSSPSSTLISARIDALRTEPDPAVRSHGYRLLEPPLPPRHRRHGAVPGDDRDQPAHVGPLRLPDQHHRRPPAPQLGPRRPSRRPRAHPRRTARGRPGDGPRGDGAAHRHHRDGHPGRDRRRRRSG